MEHLDEGMAHAWIDGELSADDAVSVETHLQSCATCAAIVAEARGLVAATSRIVSQLDHVSAGVIPAAISTRPAALRARRVWWRHPAFAVAAVLGVTTMSWLSLRSTTGGRVATIAGEHAPTGDVTAAAAVAPNASASTSAVASPTKVPASRARDARAPSAGAGAAVRPDAQRLAVRDEAEPTRTIAPAASAPTPTAPMQAAPAAKAASTAESPMPVPRLLEDRTALAANRAGASGFTSGKASFAASASLAGCYVLARADNTARSATMQLPPRIRLTDSVRTTGSATATFLAYGMRDGTTAEIPLQYRRVGASAFDLSPAFDDAVIGNAALGEAAFVRVLALPADGARPTASPTDAQFVARRQSCP